jgi:hypothetical protein
MKQLDIFGKETGEADHEIHTCGECEHLYKRNKWYKCPKKPRGFGYDLTLKHPACIRFKIRVSVMKKYGRY